MMSLHVKLLITFLVAMSFVKLSWATTTFYTAHTQGWHWYHDPRPAVKHTQSVMVFHSSDPLKAMAQLHQQLNRALDRAILVPTIANVQQYMRLQQWVTQHASLFTTRWQHVLLQNPRLDYAIHHPTSSLGRTLYLTRDRVQTDNALHQFAQHHGLFFFYRGDCEYCERFAPILKAFAEDYHLKVIPISLGGGTLPSFPHSQRDHGQAALLHVQVWPAVFAVNPKSHRIVPVAYGLLTRDALRQRLLQAMAQFHDEKRALPS